MALTQSSIDAFSALALGFALAGLLASGFELVCRRPLGFSSPTARSPAEARALLTGS